MWLLATVWGFERLTSCLLLRSRNLITFTIWQVNWCSHFWSLVFMGHCSSDEVKENSITYRVHGLIFLMQLLWGLRLWETPQLFPRNSSILHERLSLSTLQKKLDHLSLVLFPKSNLFGSAGIAKDLRKTSCLLSPSLDLQCLLVRARRLPI